MEREQACVCDHGYERSGLCAEIIIIIIIIIPTFCYYFYPPPTIVHVFIHFCPKYTHFDHSSTLKRRPQTSVTAVDLVWVCAPPRTANGYDA